MRLISSFLNYLGQLRDRPGCAFLFLLEVAVAYLRATIIVKYMSLNKYFYKFFASNNSLSSNLEAFQKDIYIIKRILNKLPRKPTCLVESITIHLYLRRKGICAPIQLGIKTTSGLEAHAWITSYEGTKFRKLVIQDAKTKEAS
jgi:hypothetical protein